MLVSGRVRLLLWICVSWETEKVGKPRDLPSHATAASRRLPEVSSERSSSATLGPFHCRLWFIRVIHIENQVTKASSTVVETKMFFRILFIYLIFVFFSFQKFCFPILNLLEAVGFLWVDICRSMKPKFLKDLRCLGPLKSRRITGWGW